MKELSRNLAALLGRASNGRASRDRDPTWVRLARTVVVVAPSFGRTARITHRGTGSGTARSRSWRRGAEGGRVIAIGRASSSRSYRR